VVRPVKGDVVVVPFPFSDLSSSKKRPALVVTVLSGDDVILCAITTQSVKDSSVVAITKADFQTGGLKQDSNVRPSHLFTADRNMIINVVGRLTSTKVTDVVNEIVKVVTA
jgi:mRNA interferase MazF